MVGVGAMVGAGIFVLCGVAMEQAGPGAMLAFALNGVLALVTAFSFAELGSTFPESGGGYVFAKKVFPIGGAFAAGWVLWFAYVVACALYSLGFASFASFALSRWAGLTMPAWFDGVAAAGTAVVAVGVLVLRGASAGNWISFAKVVAFLILIGAGVLAFSRSEAGTLHTAMVPMLPYHVTGVLAAMGFTFIALEGFEIIAAIGEEVRHPSRTIPRAMFLSIGITLVVYMGLLFAVLTVGGSDPAQPAWRELGPAGDEAVAIAARRFAGPLGGIVVVVAGLLATFSALTATLLAASRISYSMARDRALPRSMSLLHGKSAAPMNALVVSGVLVILVIAAAGNVEVAGAAASLIFLLSFGLTNAAGLLVRMRVGAGSGYRAPLYPWLPLLGIAACLGLALFQVWSVPAASLIAIAWLLVGGVLYRISFARYARTVSARAETLDSSLIRLRGRSPLVLVPVANPERARPLLQFGYALATPDIDRLLAVTVAPFDREAEPGENLAAYAHAQAVLGHAVETACELGRPFEGSVLLARDITDAIARVAAERHPETILLGMSNMGAQAGTDLLEKIIARTAANVAVLNAPPRWSLDGVKRVLVPVAGGAPHDPLRARVLGMLLRGDDAQATLLRILRAGEDQAAARRLLQLQSESLGLPTGSYVIEMSEDPVEVIVRHSAEADLLVLGFAREGGRKRLLGGFALDVVKAARCPVVAIAQARRR